MAKISVVIPVYNSEKYIEKCIKSLVNQTLKDIEIICVNDGSSDNSRKLLENFAEIEGDVYATYDETANTVTVEINGTGYEVVATPTANATLTVKFSDGSSASLETALDFSAVRPDADTVYYDSSLGTSAEEQGATAFSATATVYDAAGNAYTIEIRIYMSIINRIQTEPPVEPEIPETDETPSDGENA